MDSAWSDRGKDVVTTPNGWSKLPAQKLNITLVVSAVVQAVPESISNLSRTSLELLTLGGKCMAMMISIRSTPPRN